jgi:hypothetical protein
MSGVEPRLIEAIQEGGKRAFGDPNDPNTRYIVRPEGGYRVDPGSFHNRYKAVDLQIFDRQTGQFVGGAGGIDSIMKNAFGNPSTYRTYEALAQGGYQYLYEKYGPDVAKILSWGGRFGRSRQGTGPDEMHYSWGEGGSLGPIWEQAHGMRGSTGTITDWLAGAGAAPSRSMGANIPGWKSELNTQFDPYRELAKAPWRPSPRQAMPYGGSPFALEEGLASQLPGARRGPIDLRMPAMLDVNHPGALAANADVVHKVEGTGTIRVNVTGPRGGINVSAEGGGLFNKVEVNRGTTGTQASDGPSAATGNL